MAALLAELVALASDLARLDTRVTTLEHPKGSTPNG